MYKKKDLIAAIKRGLHDEDIREKLRVAREKFVYEHSYKRDGESAERVIKLIERMVKVSCTRTVSK